MFRVIKVISETDVATYLSIRTGGYTASVGERGVILLLEDGTKLEWPNEVMTVDVNTCGFGFSYTAFIRLTDEQIDQLAKLKISGAKLYIYEALVTRKRC